MKIDTKIDHNANGDFMKSFGISEERADEINTFIGDLFTNTAKKGMKKTVVVEKIIEFANNTLEAVVMFGFFEKCYAKESINAKMGGLASIFMK